MPAAGVANGELKVVGTLREGKAYNPYHSDHFIWVVGRADMQPPFKRRDPGSTPGRPMFNFKLSNS